MKIKKLLVIVLVLSTLIGALPVFALAAGNEAVAVAADSNALNPTIYGKNLALEDSIYISYAVPVSGTEGADAVKMLFWTTPQSDYSYGTQAWELSPVGYSTVNGTRCYVFSFNKLAAKQMTVDVYAKVYATVDGKAYYSALDKYSVLQYAYNMLGKTSSNVPTDNMRNLLNDLLSYGASAQTYFNTNTDRLATDTYYQIKVVGGTLADGSNHGLYLKNDRVKVTAPETNAIGEAFLYWRNSSGAQASTNASNTFTVRSSNETYTAVYKVYNTYGGAHPAIKEGTSAVRVMSFNVQGSLPKSNGVLQPAALNRIEAVKQEILYYTPDLLGLQEDNLTWVSNLILDDYYVIQNAGLPGISDGSERCAIYYKKGMTLLESGSDWLTYNGTSSVGALTWKDVTDPNSKFYLTEQDRYRLMLNSEADLIKSRKDHWDENTGKFVTGTSSYQCSTVRKFTYGVFEVNGQKLIYVNTHLTHRSQNADYSNDELQKVRSLSRIKEWDLLMIELAEIEARYPDALVFFTGDFNDNKGKPIYNYVTQDWGYLSAEAVTLKHVGTKGSWNNAFNLDKQGDTYPSTSGKEGTSKDYLDYCFVEDGLTVERFTVGAGKAKIQAVEGGEKIIYTSDHLPVITDLSFKTATTGTPIVPDHSDSVVDSETVSVYTGRADTSWYTGDKTEYTLTTADQFAGFLSIRQSGGGNVTFEGVTIKLAKDLVINQGPAEDFIKRYPYQLTALNSNYAFKGVFDGQGHTISGVYLQCTTTAIKGLFGGIGDNAVIKDLTLDNCYAGGPSSTGKTALGIVAGRIIGTNVVFSNIKVTNCLMLEGTANFTSVGALVGRVDSNKSLTVENCEVTGLIDFGTKGSNIGSLVGEVQSGATLTVKNSTSGATIKGLDLCGGLVGNSAGNTVIDNKSSFNGTIICPGSNKDELIGNS